MELFTHPVNYVLHKMQWRISSTLEKSSLTKDVSRVAQTIAALSRLKIIWRDKHISLASKVKLMQMLILYTFLYACESWTLTEELERSLL